jgi:hypothetical protein
MSATRMPYLAIAELVVAALETDDGWLAQHARRELTAAQAADDPGQAGRAALDLLRDLEPKLL